MDACSAPAVEPISKAFGTSLPATLTRPHISEPRACRVCGRTRLYTYLDLGLQALANDLRSPNEDFGTRVPLRLQACFGCKLSQLSHVVPKEWLYTDYAYRSGVSVAWQKHCARLAQEYARDGALTLDIASNDGTLVREFAKRGCNAMGVEPSESFADCVYNRITGWWTPELVARLNLESQVEVLTAQNVLGHVDDVHAFIGAMALALAADGVAIVEVPYVGDLLRSTAFDTIYHEHLSYWSVTALKQLVEAHGLRLCDVQHLGVHGGSLRAVVRRAKHDAHKRVEEALVDELHDLQRAPYLQFSARVTRRIAEINETLLSVRPYVGFGAAAKTSVMLQCLDVRAYPQFVYDDNPLKWGKCVPGTRVRIEPPPPSWTTAPGPMCMFAWNWADHIIEGLRERGYDGEIYVPLPKPGWDTVDA